MDEVPVNFDMVAGAKVVDKRSVDRPIVMTTGADKRRATVVLCCSSDGALFPPMIIFKGTKKHVSIREIQKQRGTTVRVQKSAWMTTELYLEWLRQNLVKYLGDTTKPSLLVLDNFRGHKDRADALPKIERVCTKNNIKLAWIPPGCTPLLQPLDVAINR